MSSVFSFSKDKYSVSYDSKTIFIVLFTIQITFLAIFIQPASSKEDVQFSKQVSVGLKNKHFSPRSLSNLLIAEVFKQEEREQRITTTVQEQKNNNNNPTLASNWNFSTQGKIFNVQVAAIHVDKAEFPLSKLLFKLTLKLALSDAEKRLESRRIKLSLNIRSANTCSSQYAGAVAAEEYYLKKARLFIVSGCDDAIRGVSRLASAWGVPVMTAAGFGADLNDKSIHRTLVRVAFSLKNAVKFLIKILRSFSWQRVNLIVDESDPNSFALKNSIERHSLELNEFQMHLNTISLDLQSLTTTTTTNINNNYSTPSIVHDVQTNSSSQSFGNFNRKSSTPASSSNWSSGGTEDEWPNDVTEEAVRDALKQSSLFSRVNILLIPHNYLRKFMLSVYDENMANGLYTFINMPLLLITSSSPSTTDIPSSAGSFAQQLPTNAASFNYNSLGKKLASAPSSNSSSTTRKHHHQQQQSYTAQTGENVFLWRSLRSDRNAHAKQAFESLMSIYLKTPTTKAYVYFTGKLVNLANTDYATTTTTAPLTLMTSNLSYNKSEAIMSPKIQLNVNPYAASFYDCFQIYVSLLNESFGIIEKQLQHQEALNKSAQKNSLLNRKKIISSLHSRIAGLVRKRRFDNMVTGSIIFNDNGDRETDYTLDDMNPMTGKFSPVILYKGESKEIERLSRIHWSSDETIGQTVDNVDCSLNGTCVSRPWSRFMMTLMLVSAPMSVLMSLILYCVYTQINLESQLVDYWWKISLKDVELVETRRKDGGSSIVTAEAGGSQVSIFNRAYQQKQVDDDITDLSDKTSRDAAGGTLGGGKKFFKKEESEYARTIVTKATTTSGGFASTAADVCYGDIHLGVYKLAKVALKPIDKFNQSRKLMIELRTIKTISHNNLCRFAGILVEEPNLALVSEFCPKGSLREFFQNESMVIDWTFKYSIINDIIAGLLYLHSSPIEYHGRLKSSNCLVSSRFVVKLSDYGLRSLYEQLDENYDELDLMKKKIWSAPEHLKLSTLNKSGSVKGDVYSFGLLLYEIITNKIPFFDNKKNDFIMPLKVLYNELKNKGPSQEKTGPHLSLIDMDQNKDLDSLINLMKRSWLYDPNKRLSMQEANATIKRITKGVTSKKLLENLTGRMEQYTNNLESLVEAKLATLVDEKSKAEELLYQFVPKSVASLLKEGQSVEPEAFDCVTLFYSDIVGFTSLSGESSPMEVIDFLSDLYVCFDSTLEQYDIFKVDTIGDAYIVASGLPKRNEGKHVIEIARAALELRERISTFKIPHKPNRRLQMRVGIASGGCIAGIVGGVNMPKYCVFGDTLTTAKFMESSGLPMKIHITEESKILLDSVGGFKIEPRTPKISKDGLPFQTYWLENELNR